MCKVTSNCLQSRNNSIKQKLYSIMRRCKYINLSTTTTRTTICTHASGHFNTFGHYCQLCRYSFCMQVCVAACVFIGTVVVITVGKIKNFQTNSLVNL